MHCRRCVEGEGIGMSSQSRTHCYCDICDGVGVLILIFVAHVQVFHSCCMFWVQLSSVIYFRHNDMQDCVIKLGKWYRTAVAEARGRFFVFLLCGSSRKQMLCNHVLHLIQSLDISFLHLKILAMRSCPFRKYRNCMLKETSISL